jgi:prepilin-type N-terminal cleavage/methylation domain-containing protein
MAPETEQDEAGDTGFTLIEMIIAMFVFSIFLAIVVSSIYGLTTAATRIQVNAVSSNQELVVFQRLDRQIRYADGINPQGTGSSGDVYFEFRTPSDSTPNNLTMCTQWRYDPKVGTIASRQWQDGNFGSQTVWNVQLTNVYNDGGATYPFNFIPATSTDQSLEQLVVTLDSGNTRIKGNAISSNFVARNSVASPTNAPGSLCPAAGSRP